MNKKEIKKLRINRIKNITKRTTKIQKKKGKRREIYKIGTRRAKNKNRMKKWRKREERKE